MYVDAAVRDYGPLETDEFAIFSRITSRAGWDGGWCTESVKELAAGFSKLSPRAVSDVLSFLVAAQLVEKLPIIGEPSNFRPKYPTEWADPQQLHLIRAQIYKHRRRQPGAEDESTKNVELLALKTKAIQAKHGEQTNQLSITSLSTLFEFNVTPEMEAWAGDNCPNVVHLSQVTIRFISEIDTKVKGGWDISNVDLVEEWKGYVRKAQYHAERALQKGRRNVSQLSTGNQQRTSARPRFEVPRFGTKRS
jgi:hypothetical protein